MRSWSISQQSEALIKPFIFTSRYATASRHSPRCRADVVRSPNSSTSVSSSTGRSSSARTAWFFRISDQDAVILAILDSRRDLEELLIQRAIEG